MLWFLIAAHAVALAGEPRVDVHADGAVVGRITVPASAADIRLVVDDPVRCGSLSPEVVSLTTAPPQGDCQELFTETRGLFRPLRVRSQRCRTADGWEEALIESDDFSQYASSWSLHEVDGQTEVTLRVRTEVGLPVPTSVVETRSKKSVGEILENLLQQILNK